MRQRPRVSLGLPIYNGEQYVAAALDSALSQTYSDFEIVISDNASTDRTREICEEYAARDPRISYHRAEVNRGAAWNFRHTFELSTGDYFKWLSHDDLMAPKYLERCVAALEANPQAVLAFPLTTVIDEDGAPLLEPEYRLRTASPAAHERFGDLLFGSDQCYEVFGLIRADALRRTQVMGSYAHADGVLLGHLALMGAFERVPERLFFSRRHAQQSIRAHAGGYDIGRPDYHAYTVWFDTAKRGKITFPNWRILFENTRALWKSNAPFAVQARCYTYLLRWTKRHRAFLAYDLRIAARMLLERHRRAPSPEASEIDDAPARLG